MQEFRGKQSCPKKERAANFGRFRKKVMPLLFGSWSAGGGALLALLAALVMAFSLCGLFLGCGGGCGLCGVSTLACGLSKRKASAQQQCAYNREQLLHSVYLWGKIGR